MEYFFINLVFITKISVKNSTALPNVVMDDIKLGWEKNKKILPISGQSEEGM